MTFVETGEEVGTYAAILAEYLHTRGEEALYRASILSRDFVERGVGPEEIIALHFEAVAAVTAGLSFGEQARVGPHAHQFLLEVMITYGAQFKEYLELKLADSVREAEVRAVLERQRALDAERAQDEKNDILAMIAHELWTPITAVRGSVDLAARALSRGQLEQVAPLLVAARSALDRLVRLSGDLVTASRDDTPILASAPLDLAATVAQACDWAEAAAEEKIELVVVARPGRVPIVGDVDALLTVFGNLLSNAVRYTPDGGRVTVRLDADGADARVEVQDTGLGMTPAVRARIFEQFYRGPEAWAADAQELGLGLALAHRLVHAHGGRIEVESVPSQGSTFRVVLPLASPVE